MIRVIDFDAPRDERVTGGRIASHRHTWRACRHARRTWRRPAGLRRAGRRHLRHRTTSGNPLLLRQLIRALHTEGVRPGAAQAGTVTAIGSRAVSSMVLMRLARLPREAPVVARAVAVLGEGAALPSVARLAELSETATVSAIATLARAEVLRNEHPLGFVHPLVADAVYRDLSVVDTFASWDDCLTFAHARGSLFSSLAPHMWRGYMQLRRGDLREACNSFNTSIEQTNAWGSRSAPPTRRATSSGC